MSSKPLFGLMAEFESVDDLMHAAERVYAEGYRKLDAYTPFPVEGLAEAIGFHRTMVPQIALTGGLIGCFGGFFLQWWPNVIGYPLNIGGKPHNSWPSFIPITFELTILCTGLSIVFGMLALNGLPTPYHPVFNAPNFDLASRNRFFLSVETADPKFELAATREFLQSLHALEVSEIEA
jgi:hypothetical protein